MSLLVYRAAWPYPEQARLLLRRLGLAPPGVGPVTLDEAGRMFGVSGAWVGHLERRTAAAARSTAPPASLLDAVQVLGAGPRRPSVEAVLELHAAGLTHDVLHPATVAAAARLMSLPVRFTVLQTAGGSAVVPVDEGSRAQRLIRRPGLVVRGV